MEDIDDYAVENKINEVQRLNLSDHSQEEIVVDVDTISLGEYYVNKNNSSGVRGVHYDKTRKLWVAQLCSKGRCICWADSRPREKQ